MNPKWHGDQTMKIWVTKYALTNGVRVREGTIDGNYARVSWPGGLNGTLLLSGGDFATSEEGARNRVKEKIEARRKSLQKALKKLDALEESGSLPEWK